MVDKSKSNIKIERVAWSDDMATKDQESVSLLAKISGHLKSTSEEFTAVKDALDSALTRLISMDSKGNGAANSIATTGSSSSSGGVNANSNGDNNGNGDVSSPTTANMVNNDKGVVVTKLDKLNESIKMGFGDVVDVLKGDSLLDVETRREERLRNERMLSALESIESGSGMGGSSSSSSGKGGIRDPDDAGGGSSGPSGMGLGLAALGGAAVMKAGAISRGLLGMARMSPPFAVGIITAMTTKTAMESLGKFLQGKDASNRISELFEGTLEKLGLDTTKFWDRMFGMGEGYGKFTISMWEKIGILPSKEEYEERRLKRDDPTHDGASEIEKRGDQSRFLKGRHRKQYRNEIESGQSFTPSEAEQLQSSFGLSVPETQIVDDSNRPNQENERAAQSENREERLLTDESFVQAEIDRQLTALEGLESIISDHEKQYQERRMELESQGLLHLDRYQKEMSRMQSTIDGLIDGPLNMAHEELNRLNAIRLDHSEVRGDRNRNINRFEELEKEREERKYRESSLSALNEIVELLSEEEEDKETLLLSEQELSHFSKVDPEGFTEFEQDRKRREEELINSIDRSEMDDSEYEVVKKEAQVQALQETRERHDARITQSAVVPVPETSKERQTRIQSSPVSVNESHSLLKDALAEKGISDDQSVGNIFAQVEAESNFVPQEEQLHRYSARNLYAMFGPNQSKNKVRFRSMDEAQRVVSQGPEAVGDVIYGNRMGNTEEGDGFRYRGRGYIQLTGKDNYEKYGERIGVDLVDDPDLANDPSVASSIAAEYFSDAQNRGVNLKDTHSVTRSVGAATNDGNRRASLAQKWKSKVATIPATSKSVDVVVDEPTPFTKIDPPDTVVAQKGGVDAKSSLPPTRIIFNPDDHPIGEVTPTPSTILLFESALRQRREEGPPKTLPPSRRVQIQKEDLTSPSTLPQSVQSTSELTTAVRENEILMDAESERSRRAMEMVARQQQQGGSASPRIESTTVNNQTNVVRTAPVPAVPSKSTKGTYYQKGSSN